MVIIDENSVEQLPGSVATIGFFDGVHLGHLFLIDQVKELASKHHLASAVLTFPVHPRKVIHSDFVPSLLSSPDEKMELLTEARVDYCFLLDFTQSIASLTAKEFMQEIMRDKFNVKELVIGYDHRFGHNREEGFEDYKQYGEQLGIKVYQAKAFDENGTKVSSSVVRNYLAENNIRMANKCLGYSYQLHGKVVLGNQLGRTIGFPTANIEPHCSEKLVPADGVYVVDVIVQDKSLRGMLNIGNRPTVNNGTNRTIEANIFDFDADIYGQDISVRFLDFLRPQKKFPSINDLVDQLKKDREAARIY